MHILSIFFLFSQAFGYIQKYETPVVHYLKPVVVQYKKSNFEPVDCIFVINLDKRLERWKKLESECDKRKLLVNRFSALDGCKLSDSAVKNLIGNYQSDLKKGWIGCLLSHVSILKAAHTIGFNIIWILEDDAAFVEDVSQLSKIIAKLTKIDPDWDVLYTDVDGKNVRGETVLSLSSCFRPDDHMHLSVKHYLRRERVAEDIMRIGQRFGTHSLILSRKGIEKILYFFTHVYLYSPLDIDMHYIPGIREYSVIKDIVSVVPQRSDTFYE